MRRHHRGSGAAIPFGGKRKGKIPPGLARYLKMKRSGGRRRRRTGCGTPGAFGGMRRY